MAPISWGCAMPLSFLNRKLGGNMMKRQWLWGILPLILMACQTPTGPEDESLSSQKTHEAETIECSFGPAESNMPLMSAGLNGAQPLKSGSWSIRPQIFATTVRSRFSGNPNPPNRQLVRAAGLRFLTCFHTAWLPSTATGWIGSRCGLRFKLIGSAPA